MEKKSDEDNGNSCAMRVIVRIRPLNDKERSYGVNSIVKQLKNKTIEIQGTGMDLKTFHFDHCIGQEKPEDDKKQQHQIYLEVGKELVKNAFNGFNCSVFAYGQVYIVILCFVFIHV